MATMQMQTPQGEPGYYAAQQEADGIPIVLQLWTAVLRYKWLVMAIVGAAILIGLIITLLTTPLYTATTRMDITKGDDRVTDVESVENKDSLASQEFYQTQYALLRSAALAERVVNELDLLNDPYVQENILGIADRIEQGRALDASERDRSRTQLAN